MCTRSGEHAAARAESCTQACTRAGLACDARALYQLNDCAALRRHFSCSQCEESRGADQPAFVALDAPSASLPGACLVNHGAIGCDGSHPLTTRLCARARDRST